MLGIVYSMRKLTFQTLLWALRTVCGTCILHSTVILEMFVLLFVYTASPKSVGWEKNAKDKLSHRKVDLSSSMDPVRYAIITLLSIIPCCNILIG